MSTPLAAPRSEPLLEVRGLKVHFPITSGIVLERKVGAVRAVDGVDLSLARGTTLGVVGESGCGKSTLGRAVLRLVEPTAGSVLFDGQDLLALKAEQMRTMRRRMQMVFQDPYSSLNPRQNVGNTIAEPLRVHGLADAKSAETRVSELLGVVGLPKDAANRYPHEFSGGQRQRVGLARSLALNPDLIVADEPVSALDVSIQAQVVNLIQDLQEELGLTVLFIAHDLAVVEYICDRVIVMYLGRIMEVAPSKELYLNPKHPYTEALLSAAPVPDPSVKRKRIILEGDIPSPINPPSGCVFRTRCRYAIPECANVVPELREVAPGHFKACIRDDIL